MNIARSETGFAHAGGPLVTPDAVAYLADQEFAAAVVRKDRKASAEFVERFTDPVYAYLRQRFAPRTELADDLTQEVFLAALKGLPSYGGRSALKTWVLGIARHKVEDHYRAHLRRSETPDDLDDESPFVPTEEPKFDQLIDAAAVRSKTRRVLSQLPENYSYALRWRYWERRSVREIAAETGRTEKAGERLLARARAHFKRLWEAD